MNINPQSTKVRSFRDRKAPYHEEKLIEDTKEESRKTQTETKQGKMSLFTLQPLSSPIYTLEFHKIV